MLSELPAPERRAGRRPPSPDGELDARVAVVRDPLPLADLRSLPLDRRRWFWRAWLADGGAELVLASARGRWLFLWIVDLEEGIVRRRVSLRAPDRLDGASALAQLSISQDGDRLWVVGREGILALSRRDWRVTGWRPYRGLVEEDGDEEWLEWARVLPGSSYLWFNLGRSSAVLDLESWHLQHGSEAPEVMRPVLTPGGTLALVIDDAPRLFQADGVPVAGEALPPESWTRSQAVAPDGRGFVRLALRNYREVDDEERWDLRVVWLKKLETGAYRVAARTWVREVTLEVGSRVATSLDHGLCFVLTEVLGQRLVVALSLSAAGFQELYRLPVHFSADLVQDRDCWCVALVWSEEGGLGGRGGHLQRPLGGRGGHLQVVPLGPEPPAGIPGTRLPKYWFPRIGGHTNRPISQDEGIERQIRDYELKVRELDDDGAAAFRRRFEAVHRNDPETLVRLGYAIAAAVRYQQPSDARRRRRFAGLRAWIGELLAEGHGEHPGAALFLAREEARAGRWRAAGHWLEVAAAGEHEPEFTEHLHHLRGLVLLHELRPEEAHAAFAEAARWVSGGGWFDRLLQLTRPMSDPPEAAEWGPDQPVLCRLLGAIRTADAARSAGDLDAALAALDRPFVWAASEFQSLGRLAVSVLEAPAATPAERFRKRLVLAHFCRLFEGRRPVSSRVIELPGLSWDREKLGGVAERGRAWLEKEAGDG